VCFNDVDRVLPAIAKFLVHLFGNGEGRGKMEEGEVEEESGERTGKVWKCGKWECGKNSPNFTQHIWHLGTWGLPARFIHF